MFYFLIAILGILITIFFVIGTHEAAHFFMARALGVKVLRFSIGFGKALWRKQDKSGTEYVIALIPLGGYVKMLGETDDENEAPIPPAELHRAYNQQPFYKKFLIVLAGPASNLLCAVLLYWLIFMLGFVTIKPIIGEVTPQSIAAQAGLVPKQEIIAVDNRSTNTWSSVLFRLIAHTGNQDSLLVTTKDSRGKSQTHQLDLTQWTFDELKPDPLSSLGLAPYEPEVPLIIGVIAANSPASTTNLILKDKVLAINNQPIKDWRSFTTYIAEHPGERVTLKVLRDNKEITIPLQIGTKHHWFSKNTGYLGIGPTFQWPKELLHTIQYAPLPALGHAWQEVVDFTYFNFLLFGKMLTGKLSLQSLGGPITIFETAGDALNSGWLTFLSFLAFISISIGVINLIPIPGLDGGHLLIQTIEFIIRRPISDRVLLLLYRLGFAFLFVIFIQALMNDVLRLG